MHQQLSKYGATGLIGTAAHYTVMYLLLKGGTSPVLATFTGAAIGALINFSVCREWVFIGHSSAVSAQAIRFSMTSVLILATNTILVWALASIFGVWLSQLIATACSFFLGYLINRHWTFPNPTEQSL